MNNNEFLSAGDDAVVRYYILSRRTEKEVNRYYDSWETVTELVPERVVTYTRMKAWLLQRAFDRKGMDLVLVEIHNPEELDCEELIAEQLELQKKEQAKAAAEKKAREEYQAKRAKETEEKAKERKLKKLAKLKAELGVD